MNILIIEATTVIASNAEQDDVSLLITRKMKN